MGRIIPFRRRPHRDPRTRVTLRGLVRDTLGWLRVLRPLILLGLLASLYVGAGDPALVEPPEWLATEPEPVSAEFTRCAAGGAAACVVDGDTFHLGERRIRIIGIDTPEVKARCPAEAEQAEAATAMLQGLLNQGPFEMVGPLYRDRDRYGRELRALRRKLPDGSVQSIASEMRESGLARRYLGGFRGGWC